MVIVAQYRDFSAKAGPMEPLKPYIAMDDDLALPRRIAAAVVAAGGADPKMIVDVGSFLGETLEAFLDQFPKSRGQWTDATDNSKSLAQKRLDRFGDRVDYVVGCASRDPGDGKVPKGVDVLVSSWISSHRSTEKIQKFYDESAKLIAPGGWLVVLDHVAFNGPWDQRILSARDGFMKDFEGPPPHHQDHIATREQHLAAFAKAGIEDVQVVWESLGTVLFIGKTKETP